LTVSGTSHVQRRGRGGRKDLIAGLAPVVAGYGELARQVQKPAKNKKD
jgi:hypothetical protein